MRSALLLLCILLLASCNDEVTVRPAAMLRLEYPAPNYKEINTECQYSFQKNTLANLKVKNGCGMNLEYPLMDATVYITYQEIRSANLDSLLYDAQKLTYDHSKKAQAIFEQPRVDTLNKVYGMFYSLEGNAATQSQFYVTDSLNHFVQGSLYFNAKPNFDSIYPAVMYLRNDIRRIMETISWEE
jgi:gliding motility-associated lipoprotein GldD|tara:strand:+ start:130094 stop:130648 length:555 start_codon:yes stop_codon:yes gene_type:complete